MFNRYWRDYPWMFQLIQFIILILVTASFFIFGLLPLIAKMTSIPVEAVATINEKSKPAIIHAALLYQFIGATGIFLLPALAFGYFTHPRPLKYLGLVRPGKSIQWTAVIIMVLGAVPVLMAIQSLVSEIELSEAAKKMQLEREQQVGSLLSMPSLIEFFMSFIVLAILPAVSEELFFRGVMFRLAAKGTNKIVFSIVLTGIVFALFHFDFYGFVSIFLAGTMLGFIYYLTGSIWLSMLGHLIHNGLQIGIIYFFRNTEVVKNIIKNDNLPWFVPVIGLAFFAAGLYLLLKNKTPFPPDWLEDFTEEEKKKLQAEPTEE